jgi:DNA-binding transcriptional ArsR family regulator
LATGASNTDARDANGAGVRFCTVTVRTNRLDVYSHTLQSVAMSSGLNGTVMPTLWRTCRVLANRQRLNMLRQLFRRDGMNVSEVSGAVGMPVMVTSQYLRALNARGLIKANRVGRFVVYRATADASVRAAAPLLVVLRRELAGNGSRAVERVFRAATAFTHPRRIALVRALARRPMTRLELAGSTGISTRALARHVKKLKDRGFLVHDGGFYRLTSPRRVLERTLLGMAVGQ